MPRSIAVLVAWALVPGLLNAGLRCVPPAADLGEIRGGPPRQHRFELVNDGSAAIEILEVQRGCGCLEPQLDRHTLQPGEKAKLLVSLRTTGQSNGARSWNLRIRYREGAVTREELLVLAATIRNEVTVQPPILALYVQDVLKQEIVVTDLRSPPLKVTSVQSSSAAVRATVQPAVAGVTKLRLEVTAAALANGRQDALLSIYADDPLYSPLQLPIVLTRGIKPALTISPPRVDVCVSVGEPIASTLVRLRPADGQMVVIESAEADDPGITCTFAAGPGDGATLKIRVDGRRVATRDEPRVVRVRLTEPPNEIVAIPVSIDPAK